MQCGDLSANSKQNREHAWNNQAGTCLLAHQENEWNHNTYSYFEFF